MAAYFSQVVLLAGGVGGARMAEGFARALPAGALTVIANVGDDEEFYGLRVCPDIDTLLYTLSDRIDRGQGWGVAEDTVKALDVLRELGAPAWMKLGDADFGEPGGEARVERRRLGFARGASHCSRSIKSLSERSPRSADSGESSSIYDPPDRVVDRLFPFFWTRRFQR